MPWLMYHLVNLLPIADQRTFFFIFLDASHMSLLYVCMMEKVLFHHFPMFVIVFDHANTCTSMHSLVEIHNTLLKWSLLSISLLTFHWCVNRLFKWRHRKKHQCQEKIILSVTSFLFEHCSHF